MDAATAALIGASIGVLGALGGAFINPTMSARHARRAKAYELKREAYERCIVAALNVPRADDVVRGIENCRELTLLLAQVELYGDQAVKKKYVDLLDVTREFYRARTKNGVLDWELTPVETAGLSQAFDAFSAAVRTDLGAGRLPRRKLR